jgi:deoxyribodipyrimidine photolyase
MAASRAALNQAGHSKTGLVWYKTTDLRLHDHAALTQAHKECAAVAHVFCADPRWFGTTE